MKTFGPLYALSSKDKVKVWRAEVVDDNEDEAYLWTYHGYVDGAETSAMKPIKPKNVGRSNETSPYEQACADAQSKMNKKMDEGYVLDQADLKGQVLLLPMLAKNIKDAAHKINWPAYASPKLDGNRLIAKPSIEYLSRRGKLFTTLSHLDSAVSELLNAVNISDGELYIHGLPLQDIVALSKKKRDNTSDLEYWIFDIVDETKTFEERYNKIKEFFNSVDLSVNNQGFRKYKNLVEVPNYEINNESELQEYHNKFIEMGFEGTMIRNKNGLYKLKYRSSDLLKKKDFLEEEFKIIGGKSATGNDIGTVVFICETSEGKPFDVRPKGTREKRREWLNDIDSLINKKLTVRFQYFSNDNIPCHLRGICIRDYE